MLAIDLAVLLSADVPGVKVLLSPWLLNDADCCWAFLIAFWLLPQYAPSQAENVPELGRLPNAEAFSSAASICCTSCIRYWSIVVRLAAVDFLEMSLQKPPINLPSATGWVTIVVPMSFAAGDAGGTAPFGQSSRSPIWETVATPGN